MAERDIIMKKKQLLKMKGMKATGEMLLLAKQRKENNHGDARAGSKGIYQYGSFFMACKKEGILKVSVFSAEHMRFGATDPVYDIFINKKKDDFITYDHGRQRWSEAVIDRFSGISGEMYCAVKSKKCVQEYFGENEEIYTAVLRYQLGVRQRQLEAKHRKVTDEWDRTMAQVPALPKDWVRWTRKVGITQNFIFYKYERRGAKLGYCTWCEKMVPIKSPKYNKSGKCPCCRHQIQYKSTGKAQWARTEEETMYLLQQCADGFVVREFCGNTLYQMKAYTKPVYYLYERRRVLYGRNLDKREFYHGPYKNMGWRWVEGPLKTGGLSYRYYMSFYRGKVYGKTVPSLAGGVLAATGFREWMKGAGFVSPVEYFSALREAPYLEQLVKAGLIQLVKDILDYNRGLKIKEKGELGKRLYIDRFRLGRLRENHGGMIYLEWLQKEKQQGTVLPDTVIRWMERQKIRPHELAFISDRMSGRQIKNYLERQNRETGMAVKTILSLWNDYLIMAGRLNMDIYDSIVYRVKNIVKRHDELVKAIKDKDMVLRADKIAKDFPGIDAVCGELKEKYEYSGKDYLILAPRCIEDILKEGDALHHCVDKGGNYFGRINSRESYILFLRKAEEPEKPYYTLEVEPDGTVRQKRTEYNRQLPDIEKAGTFLKRWQKQIQEKLSREDLGLAARSRELRAQELETMRKNKVRINGGDFAGKLLADVLEADLLEVREDKDIAA